MAKKRSTKSNRKKRSLIQQWFLSKGSITFKVLLAVIIIGSVALVSGIFPQSQITPLDPDAPKVRPVIDKDNINQDSLQLRSIGFEACAETVAVSLLVDVSGSMRYVDNAKGTSKLDELKSALKLFTGKMTDESIVGLASYSVGFREIIGIQPYGDVKTRINSDIDRLVPDGGTSTRLAFERMKPILQSALNTHPDKKITLIFASDGIPESDLTRIACQDNPDSTQCQANCQALRTSDMRCFAVDQDPTQEPNIAREIKEMGVTIYSIAILDNRDSRFNTQLTNLLQSVASPNSFYVAPTSDELSNIYDQIGFNMCERAA